MILPASGYRVKTKWGTLIFKISFLLNDSNRRYRFRSNAVYIFHYILAKRIDARASVTIDENGGIKIFGSKNRSIRVSMCCSEPVG